MMANAYLGQAAVVGAGGVRVGRRTGRERTIAQWSGAHERGKRERASEGRGGRARRAQHGGEANEWVACTRAHSLHPARAHAPRPPPPTPAAQPFAYRHCEKTKGGVDGSHHSLFLSRFASFQGRETPTKNEGQTNTSHAQGGRVPAVPRPPAYGVTARGAGGGRWVGMAGGEVPSHKKRAPGRGVGTGFVFFAHLVFRFVGALVTGVHPKK